MILFTTLHNLQSAFHFSYLILTSVLCRGHSSEKGWYLPSVKQEENQAWSPGLTLHPAVSPQGVRAGPPGARGAVRAGNRLRPPEPPGQPSLRAALW